MMGISRTLARSVTRAWPVVLLATLVASGLGVPSTIRLFKNISTDPIDLLPKTDPNVATLRMAREKLERGVRSNIVVESDDRNANIRFIQDMVARLAKEPYVGRVEWRKTGYDFFDRHKLLFMDRQDLITIRDRISRKIEKEKMLGFYIDLEDSNGEEEFSFKDLETKYKSKYARDVSSEYNESPDGRIFSFVVESPPGDTGLSASARFQDQLENFLKRLEPTRFHPTMKVYLTGATKVLEYQALMRDLLKVGYISAALICIPLFFRFRSLLHVLWVFLPLLVGMPASFGVTSMFVPKLNICTSFLFAILGALGVENGVHIFSRYYETRRHGLSQAEAIEEIFSKTGRAILTSVASVAITFLSMMWNDFRGFSEFGIISGLGLWVIFLVYFSFMPAMLVAAERLHLLRFSKVESPREAKFFRIPASLLTTTLIIGLFATLLSFAATASMKFEYDSQKTRAEIPELLEAKAKQRKTVSRVNSPAVLVVQNQEEVEQLKKAVEGVKEKDVLTPTIDISKSYYDLIPPDQKAKLRILREIHHLLNDKTIRLLKGENKKNVDRFRELISKTKAVTGDEISPDLQHLFKGNSKVKGDLFYINALPELELDDGRNAMAFVKDVGKVVTSTGTYFPSSEAIVYGKMLQTMLDDTPRVMIVSLILIIFFVWLDFRSFRKTLIVMTSIMLGVLWMFGLMWMFDVRLNFFNMVIIPVVLGMSIDNSIHIFHRYQELGPGSMPRVLASSGRAALIASLTNASAFIGLLFCTHKGLFSIGLLATMGVATCLVSTLFFFPVMLLFLERIRLERRRIFRKEDT
jgi:uncharacterized protein